MVEGDSHNAENFSRENWIWQYEKLSSGEARIFVCEFEGKIVGYYHVPIYIGQIDGNLKKFAMVQDVAVSRSMRGQSVFRKIAEFATEDLVNSDINLIYTFPNDKSIHTFVKYNGYKQISVFDCFILPIRSADVLTAKLKLFGLEKIAGWFADKFIESLTKKISPKSKFEKIDFFDEKTAEFFIEFGRRFSVSLNRDAKYLNWRFFEKPSGKHVVIKMSRDEKISAVVVFKLDEILKTKTAVILDFAFTEKENFYELVNYLKKNAENIFGEKIGLIFTAVNCTEIEAKYGFVKVPPKFNPRPLNLLVKNITEDEATVFDSKKWHAILSDWDVL